MDHISVGREAEEAMVGWIISYSEIPHGLTAADFYHELPRRMFEVCQRCLEQGESPTYLTLWKDLEEAGIKDAAVLASRVTDELSFFRHEGPALCRRIKNRSVKRKVRAWAQEITAAVDNGKTTDEVLDMLSVVPAILDETKRQTPTISDAFRELDEYQSGLLPGRINCGLNDLDEYAPAADELVVVAGRPGMGKTALAVNLGERYAARKIPVLFVSMEMSGSAIHQRRLAAYNRVSLSRMRTAGAMEKDDWNRVTESCQQHLKDAPFHVAAGSYRPADILAEIRRAKTGLGVKVVFIDHLTKIDYPQGERWELEIGRFTTQLARLCKDEQMVVFALSQLNRKLENRTDKVPMLSDLRDSGRIEEDADMVWFLYRDSYYTKDHTDKSFQVGIAKNRNGPTGVVELIFEKKYGLFLPKL